MNNWHHPLLKHPTRTKRTKRERKLLRRYRAQRPLRHHEPPWHLPEWQAAIRKGGGFLKQVEDENILKALAKQAAADVAVLHDEKIFKDIAMLQDEISRSILIPKSLSD